MAAVSGRRKVAAVVVLASSLAAGFEGLRLAAYRDPVGIPTVCFGHTEGVRMGDVHSPAVCRDLLDADMRRAVAVVERCAPGLGVNASAAFSSAVFNLGPAVVCGPSRAARLLAAGDVAGACRELPRWNKARVAGVPVVLPGLSRRRAAEMALCLRFEDFEDKEK